MIRPLQDNVVLVLEPTGITQSGLHFVRDTKRRGARASVWARVVASGPGYYVPRKLPLGDRKFTIEGRAFIPNETQPGDRVLINEDAGQDYMLDVSIPRHNVGHEFEELCGEKGQFRIVREQEIHLIEREEIAAE